MHKKSRLSVFGEKMGHDNIFCRCLRWTTTRWPLRPGATRAPTSPARPITSTSTTAWWPHPTDRPTRPNPHPGARPTSTTAAARPSALRPVPWFLTSKLWRLLTTGQLPCPGLPATTTTRWRQPRRHSAATDLPECTDGTDGSKFWREILKMKVFSLNWSGRRFLNKFRHSCVTISDNFFAKF